MPESKSSDVSPGPWFLSIQTFLGEEPMLDALAMEVGKEIQKRTRELDSISYDDETSYRQWALKRYKLLTLRATLIQELEVPPYNELAVNNNYHIAEMKASTFDQEYKQIFPFTDDDAAVSRMRDIFLVLEERMSASDLVAMYYVGANFFAEFEGKYQKEAIYYFDIARRSLKERPDFHEDWLAIFLHYTPWMVDEITYLKKINKHKLVEKSKEALATWTEGPIFQFTEDLSEILAVDIWKMTIELSTGNPELAHQNFEAIAKRLYGLSDSDAVKILQPELVSSALEEYGSRISDTELSVHSNKVVKVELHVAGVLTSSPGESSYDTLIMYRSAQLEESLTSLDAGAVKYQRIAFELLINQIDDLGIIDDLTADSLWEINAFESPASSFAMDAMACSHADDCSPIKRREILDNFVNSNVDSDFLAMAHSLEMLRFLEDDLPFRAREYFATHFMGKDFPHDCAGLFSKGSASYFMSRSTYLSIRKDPYGFSIPLSQVAKDIEVSRKAYAELSNNDEILQDSCTGSGQKIEVDALIKEAHMTLLGILWESPTPFDRFERDADLMDMQEQRVLNLMHSAKLYAKKLSYIDTLLVSGFNNLIAQLRRTGTDKIFLSKVSANQEIIDSFVVTCAKSAALLGPAKCITLLPVAHSLKTYSINSKDILLNTVKAAEGLSETGDSVERISELINVTASLEEQKANIGISDAIIGKIKKLERQKVGLDDQVTLQKELIKSKSPSAAAVLESRIIDLESIQARLSDDEALAIVFPEIGGFSQGLYVVVVIESAAIRTKVITSFTTDKRIDSIIDSVAAVSPYEYEAAYKIFDDLFGDVKNGLNGNGVKKVTFIGAGKLDSIPLRLLITENPEEFDFKPNDSWAYKKAEFTRSTNLIQFLGSRILSVNNKSAGLFLGVGNPHLASSQADLRGLEIILQDGSKPTISGLSRLSSLPDTETEIREIAKYYLDEPRSKILLGRDASEAKLKSLDIKQYSTIAFATHGLLSGEISGLEEPALLLTPPAESSEYDDGLLTANEISNMDMRARLVIWSACNTNVNDANSGSALTNLSNAFMHAGVTSIMATHWNIESKVATFLTTRTIKRLNENPSQGLASAMNHAIDLARERTEWQHPFFWAPFSIYGDDSINNRSTME